MSKKATVLVVDDDTGVQELLVSMLVHDGYKAPVAGSAADLKAAFAGPQPDLVLLDLLLPDGFGLDLLPLIKKQWPETEVIVLTGHASLDAAVEATKKGAYHFQKKPFDHKTLILSIDRALEHKRLNEEASSLRRTIGTLSGGNLPVFHSHTIKTVVRTAERVAPSEVPILIVGESGTGKEVIANLIHGIGPRSGGPMIKTNCAALPRDLIDAELFGSVKAASGRAGGGREREGLFHQAEGGTLLLDELCEMPVETQSKLLRVLEEKEIRPANGQKSYKVDCRIIALTNRPIEHALKEGRLREDLYYRINTVTLSLPPLRERRDDIMPLATSFLKRFTAQAGRPITGFTPAALELMQTFDWPGNVRQLQNEVQRSVLMCDSQAIDVTDLSITAEAGDASGQKLSLIEAMERNAIVQTLKETNGNKLEAARRLGVRRQTIYNKIKAYGLQSLEQGILNK